MDKFVYIGGMEGNNDQIRKQLGMTKTWAMIRSLPEIIAIVIAIGLAWMSAIQVIVAIVSAMVMLTSILWKQIKWWKW